MAGLPCSCFFFFGAIPVARPRRCIFNACFFYRPPSPGASNESPRSLMEIGDAPQDSFRNADFVRDSENNDLTTP
jgi:hypothetical protein